MALIASPAFPITSISPARREQFPRLPGKIIIVADEDSDFPIHPVEAAVRGNSTEICYWERYRFTAGASG